MRTHFILTVAIIVLLLAACGDHVDGASDAAQADCVSPSNPFNDEGGHDAGFKWAEETGGSCPDSHGESFEQGCQEFHRQLEDYERCQAEKRG
jgi:hypothetical protein